MDNMMCLYRYIWIRWDWLLGVRLIHCDTSEDNKLVSCVEYAFTISFFIFPFYHLAESSRSRGIDLNSEGYILL